MNARARPKSYDTDIPLNVLFNMSSKDMESFGFK